MACGRLRIVRLTWLTVARRSQVSDLGSIPIARSITHDDPHGSARTSLYANIDRTVSVRAEMGCRRALAVCNYYLRHAFAEILVFRTASRGVYQIPEAVAVSPVRREMQTIVRTANGGDLNRLVSGIPAAICLLEY